jgi:hypothetical protein
LARQLTATGTGSVDFAIEERRFHGCDFCRDRAHFRIQRAAGAAGDHDVLIAPLIVGARRDGAAASLR